MKPFDPNELIARIKAVLRRTVQIPMESSQPQNSPRKWLEMGNIMIDLEQYRVTVGGNRIELTPKEIELLFFLMSNPSRVFTREDLLGMCGILILQAVRERLMPM